MPRKYTNYSKTSKTPRRPFEKERLDNEMKVVGEFGLKNKREVWRVALLLAKMRANARQLLTLDEKNSKRIFEGNALLRRCVRLGLLEEDKRELDYVLAIKVGDIMARRLQTLVFKQNLAKSLHHARVLIRQRHVRVKSQMVNIPSFLVRVEQEKHIEFALTSPYGPGRPGRVKRKMMAAGGGCGDAEDRRAHV